MNLKKNEVKEHLNRRSRLHEILIALIKQQKDLELMDDGVRVFENHNNNDVINFIKHQNTDLIINLGTPRILKNKILKSSKIGVLNCHPGILPFYRGCNCVEWALLNKDIIGNTCHLMTEKIDEGPIIYKKYLKYSNKDNYYEIRARIYDQSLTCIKESIKILSNCQDLKRFEFPKNGKYWNKMNKKDFKKILKYYS